MHREPASPRASSHPIRPCNCCHRPQPGIHSSDPAVKSWGDLNRKWENWPGVSRAFASPNPPVGHHPHVIEREWKLISHGVGEEKQHGGSAANPSAAPRRSKAPRSAHLVQVRDPSTWRITFLARPRGGPGCLLSGRAPRPVFATGVDDDYSSQEGQKRRRRRAL